MLIARAVLASKLRATHGNAHFGARYRGVVRREVRAVGSQCTLEIRQGAPPVAAQLRRDAQVEHRVRAVSVSGALCARRRNEASGSELLKKTVNS